MEGEDDCKQLGDYFVVCGLPKNPKPYDLSPVLPDLEEILLSGVFGNTEGSDIHNLPVDFTHFPEPVVDIQLINANSETPDGYKVIKTSYGKKGSARILGGIKREFLLCYRRGRDKPPITSISFSTESSNAACPPNSHKLTTTYGNEDADLSGFMETRTYLMYSRASPHFGIDELAVTDIVVVLKSKGEVCPPAYHELPRSLNANKIGHEPYLCYRKSLVKEHTIAYEPQVLKWYRFPSIVQSSSDCQHREVNGSCVDSTPVYSPFECTHSSTGEAEGGCPSHTADKYLHPDICQVANFCLPWGAALESWSVEQNPPHTNFFSFVLTNEAYQRLYGVAFTFHEPYNLNDMDLDKCYRLAVDPELLLTLVPSSSSTATASSPPPPLTPDAQAQEQEISARQRQFIHSRLGDRVVGVTKTICLLSRWSFSVAYTNLLGFLYSRCFLQSPHRGDAGLDESSIPIERYLQYFLCEVPFPDLRMPSVQVQFSATTILLQRQNETSASSSSCECFFHLLDILGVQLSIQLLIHMLTEQKVVITSVQPYRLAQLGEALTSMIFPLHWTVVYIPFIYMGCIHVIQSPSPFLIGVDTRFCDFFRLPQESGVTYVDVDNRNIVSGQPLFSEKMLPKDCVKRLETSLNALDNEIRTYRSKRPVELSQASINVILERMFFADDSQPLQDPTFTLQRETRIGACIKATFREFMASLLCNYRKSLVTVADADGEELFQAKEFLRKYTDKHTRPFYQAMLDTQQWANFIRDCSYLSPRYDELAEFNSLLDHSQQQQALSSTSLVVVGGGGESNGHPPASSEHSGGSTGSTGHLHSLTLATSGSGGSGGSGSSELSSYCTAFQLTTSSQDLSLRPTRVIGPPVWPLSDLPVTVSSRVRERPSFRISIRLLHSLVSSALHRMSPSTTTTSTSDLICCSTGRSVVVVEQVRGACQAEGGGLSVTPSLSSLLQVTTTTMTTNSSRSRAGLALTGLPTEFVLPVKNTVLLRRTPSELRQANEFALHCSSAVVTAAGAADEDVQQSWAGYLVGSMYAMWFSLLPSYLAAVYAVDMRLATAATGASAPRDLHEHAMANLNGELVKAVEVMQRLAVSASDYVFIDQVCLRILLVLVYQNRPDTRHLKELLNGKWTSCSLCVFNHIHKAYQKEVQAAESVYQLPRKKGQQQKERNETRQQQQQSKPATASVLQDSLSTGDVQPDASSECSTGKPAEENCRAEAEDQIDSLHSSVVPPAGRLTICALPVAIRTGDETNGGLRSAGGPTSPVALDKPVNTVEGKQEPFQGPEAVEEPETPPRRKVDGDTCGTPLRRVAPLASTDEFTSSATSTPLPPAERSPVSSRSSSPSCPSPSAVPGGPMSSAELAARAGAPSLPSPSSSPPPPTAAVVARPTLRLSDLSPRPLPVRSWTTGDALASAGGPGQAVGDRHREPMPPLPPQAQEREESLREEPEEAGEIRLPPSTDHTTGKPRPSWSLGQPPSQSPVPTESPGTSWRTRLWSYDLLKRKVRDLLSPTVAAPPQSTSRLYQQQYQQRYGYTPWTPQPQRLSSRNGVGAAANAVDSTDDAAVGCHTGGDGRHLSLGRGGSSSSRIPRDMSRWSRKVTAEFARPSPPVPLSSLQRGPRCEQENGVVIESNVGRRSSEAVALNNIRRIGVGAPQPRGEWNISSVKDIAVGRAAPSSPRWLAVAGPMAVGGPEDKCCASSLTWLLRNRRQAAAAAAEKPCSHPPGRQSPAVAPGTATPPLPTGEATKKNSVPETTTAASAARLKSDLLVGDWPRVFRLRVTMTTCSRCSDCGALMFDEEIMSAWYPTRAGYPDDLPARDPSSAAYSGSSCCGCCTVACGSCGQQLLPLLTVHIAGELTTEAARRLLSLRDDGQAATATVGQPDCSPMAAVATRQEKASSEQAAFPQSCTTPESDKSTSASPSKRTIPLVPVELCQLTYPYRSPVLLRRDLEQVLQTEGDAFFRWPAAASVAAPAAPITPYSQRVSVSAPAGGGGGSGCGTQTNHLPVSSSSPVLSSLFHRQPVLTWNLIWCFHRLGLPTHLLDLLPTWLAEVQADLRKLIAACPPRDLNEAFFDELRGCWNLLSMLHVDFYTPRPSVRLYSYWMPLEARHEALYQQLLRWFREYKSSEMLVPHGQRLHPGSLGLRRDSNCPVEVAITAVIEAWRDNRLDDAVRSLVMLRAQANKYGPEVRHRSQPVRSPAHQQEHGQEHQQGHHRDTRAGHTCSWTLNSNIYRELGFLLAVQQQQSASFDFNSFDEKYLAVCQRMLQDGIQLTQYDHPPDRLAARYRSLLRRLSLD